MQLPPAAIVLLVLSTSTVTAQGWQGHPGPGAPDPFREMIHSGNETGQWFSCCHGQDCGYTDQCSPAGGGIGVIGPDQKCHAVPDKAQEVQHCAPDTTSACFTGSDADPTLLCACLGGV